MDSIKDVVKISKELFDKGLVTGKAGNISIRYNKDSIAITPTLKSLGDLKEEDIVIVNYDGDVLTKGKPSSEVGMHLEIYKNRDDVNAIVHTHSPYATGFAFSDKKIKRLEGFGKINKEYLEELEYKKPGSVDLALGAAKALGKDDVLILKNHGVIAVSFNLKEAGELAGFVEETSKTQFISHVLNSI